MTLTQKILAAHTEQDEVFEGQLIECSVDLALANDITAPIAINEFRRMGAKRVFDPSRIVLVPDHFTPNKDIAAAEQVKQLREFAGEQGITHYFEVGRVGIEHALLPEQGLVAPGELVIGADSHTCTYGALGAFATGVGSTDLAAAMATGRAWFKVPPSIRLILNGRPGEDICGKDVILHILGLISIEGARYQSMEFTGDVSALSLDDRFTIANMAVEAGAKNGVFETDEAAVSYARERGGREGISYTADADAGYTRNIEIDLSAIEQLVARPHRPDRVVSAKSIAAERVRIDQAVIGSCTNGRLSDMRAAAKVLRGRQVHESVRLIVIPATREVFTSCLK